MIIIGLTGSIGMGKSTVAKMFAEAGAPAFDSDAAVHALYAKGGAAVEPVGAAFPGSVRDGAIDRAELSRLVVDNPAALKRLEQLVHPLVRQAQVDFAEAQRAAGARVVVFDIPLLLEGKNADLVDKVVVVSAPADVQRARVLARPGMTEEKFAYLLSRQMPDAEKRDRADFVIDTGGDLESTRAQVAAVLDALGEPD
ncbi:MAG: dephospho-CoA kinase [Hyphomonadaceae bacterium]|nr:dephospho-CoA kinase [Hyphomonadaceae bacterium]